MTQPEALRLADAIDPRNEDELFWRDREAAAAELRRLHDDYENALKHFAEAVDGYKQMAAQRDALLEALKVVIDDLMYKDHARVIDVARSAIAKCEK